MRENGPLPGLATIRHAFVLAGVVLTGGELSRTDLSDGEVGIIRNSDL
jgi:hypothetical protein